MRGKLLFIAGAAVGYVVGARQGRQAYVKLKARAEELWNRPAVQNSVESAREFVKDNVPVVGEKVAQVGKKAASAVSEKVSGSNPGGSNSEGSESSGSNSSGSNSDTSAPDASASDTSASDTSDASTGRDA